MRSKTQLTLDDAKRVALAAETFALQNNWQVVIAIVDDGGHLLYLQRDQAQLGSIEVAIQKAKTALLFKRPSKIWDELVSSGKAAYLAMPGVLPVEGGLPFVVEGEVVGAIGISGVKSIEDGQIAQAGVAAL